MRRSLPNLVKSPVLKAALCLSMCIAILQTSSPCGAQTEPVQNPMPELTLPDPDDLLPAVLHNVIDGDSVELFVQGRIVRYELVGADAPDIVKDTESPLFGSVEARDFLSSLLVGEQLAVLPDSRKPTDALGRSRGYLYRMPDKLFVNLELVRTGHAKHTRDPSGFNNAAFRWAQDRARDASKGVWAPRPEPPKPPKPAPEEKKQESKPTPKQSQPESQPETNSSSQSEPAQPVSATDVVYVTVSGSKYHTKDCRHTSDSSIAKKRSEVEKTHQPCKVCEPDKSR